MQPLQEADDSPSSEGKVVVSSPPGAPEDTVIARVTEIVALLLYADGYITNVLKEAGFAIVIEITPIDFSTAHPWRYVVIWKEAVGSSEFGLVL